AKNILDVIIMSAIILLILGIIILISVFTIKRGHRSDTLVLTSSLDRESGYHGTEDLSNFAGKEGIALTALRPSGTMGIGNQKIDVVSEFGFIGIGTKIKIIDVKGRRIVVREVK
ncbi:MAG: hypothetical protein GX992_03025, partial [Clostridium sp.]|nr:hypothetical protein [Clostridium sp.]